MKVKDLIKILRHCDPDSEIVSIKYVGGDDALVPLSKAREIQEGAVVPGMNCVEDPTYTDKTNRAKQNLIQFDFKW